MFQSPLPCLTSKNTVVDGQYFIVSTLFFPLSFSTMELFMIAGESIGLIS